MKQIYMGMAIIVFEKITLSSSLKSLNYASPLMLKSTISILDNIPFP